ncbi:hypothetical protein [Saccharopolyspora sp. NPDC002376]
MMQTHGGQAAEKAIMSAERYFTRELLFDWNRDGKFDHPYSDLSAMVRDPETDKNLTGALPPSTPLLAGTAASRFTVTLTGARNLNEPAANVVLSQYNPDSPLYNVQIRNTPMRYSITVHTDDGPVTYRQFTGRVRISRVSAESDDVSVECLDAVEVLQEPIWLPAFGDLNGTESKQMFSSHWVFDRVLRANGFYQSPPAHPDACFSATLHGGTCPEIGLASPSTFYNATGEFSWAGGGDEPMYFDSKGLEFSTSGNTAGNRIPRPNVGNTIGLGFRCKRAGSGEVLLIQWLNGQPLGIDIPGNYEKAHNCALSLRLNSAGRLVLQLQNYYGTNTYDKTFTHPTTIVDTGWHTVQGECTFNAGNVVFRLKLDDGAWQTTTLAGAYPAYTAAALFPPYPYIEWPLWVQCQAFAPVTNIQTYANKTPMVEAFPADFEPTARLDAGMNRLTAIPEFTEKPSWEILKTLAETEFGSLHVDEYGVVQFTNMATTRQARETPDSTISADHIVGLSITDATDSVINTITGTVKPYNIGPLTIFDASSSSTLFDKSSGTKERTTFAALDDFTAQPRNGVPSVTIWPEVKGMIWPSTIGRNTLPYYTPDTWTNSAETIFHGVGAVHASNGTEPGTKPTVDVWLDEQNTLYVAVFNQTNTYAVQISNGVIDAATPPGSNRGGKVLRYTLKIAGVVLIEQPEMEYKRVDESSIAANGHQPYEMPSNEWTQSYAAMTYLADRLLENVAATAIPLVEDITLPADPRRQLGDTLEITNAGHLGGSLLTIISGITRSETDDGLVDRCSLKLVHRPASWLLGDPTYSILGKSTILTP